MQSFWGLVVVALASTCSVFAFTVHGSVGRVSAHSKVWVRKTSTLVMKSEEASAAEAPVKAERVALDDLEVGSTYEGTVKRVTDFGAFVDLGAQSDGLVHKSQLSDDFVADVAEFISEGTKVSVRVLSVDTEKTQISLTMKSKDAPRRERAPRAPRAAVDLSKYEAMDFKEELTATVKNLAAFGAFVEFEDGVQGLVHISRLADSRTEDVASVCNPGDSVKVRVLGVENGKLVLTMQAYKEGESKPTLSKKNNDVDDGDSLERRKRPERIEDIWSDNTEPKWAELNADLKTVEYDSLIELRL